MLDQVWPTVARRDSSNRSSDQLLPPTSSAAQPSLLSLSLSLSCSAAGLHLNEPNWCTVSHHHLSTGFPSRPASIQNIWICLDRPFSGVEQTGRRKWHSAWFCSYCGSWTDRSEGFPIRLISVSVLPRSKMQISFGGGVGVVGKSNTRLQIYPGELVTERRSSAQWWSPTWFYWCCMRKTTENACRLKLSEVLSVIAVAGGKWSSGADVGRSIWRVRRRHGREKCTFQIRVSLCYFAPGPTEFFLSE